MARRPTLYLPVMIVAALMVASAVALLAVSQKAEATFPDKNGRIAYSAFDLDGGVDEKFYTIKPGGGAKTKLTRGYQPSFSPDGKRFAYTVLGRNSARDGLSENSQGFQPSSGTGPAYNASEKLQLTKTEAGARVTLNWVYAEENNISIGYQVEDLKDDRRVAGHPAELQPLLGFGYGKPTPREEEYLKKSGLGTDIVALTDERSTKFRMVDNSVESSYGKPAKGPLENLVAFKPKEGLKPSNDHDFRLQVPLYESAVVPLQGKQPPPEPFPGEPFVFKFDVPVHAVHVVDVNQKATAKGVTLRLDRVINSPGRPRAVICYQPPDGKHYWFMYGGGAGVFQDGWSTSGWAWTGSMSSVPPGKCQKLMLEDPVEGRTSVEVKRLEGEPDCPYNNAKDFEACYQKIGYRTIRGPWKFEFKVPSPAGGAGPEREADD
jgi:hypothetical protein